MGRIERRQERDADRILIIDPIRQGRFPSSEISPCPNPMREIGRKDLPSRIEIGVAVEFPIEQEMIAD